MNLQTSTQLSINRPRKSLRSLTVGLAAAAMLASGIIVSVPALVSANGSCPVSVNEQGSTTVGPALVQAQPGFQSSAGCTLNIVQNGSGAGLTALLNNPTTVDIAASSRPLKPTEQNSLYAWQIGADAMVIAVKSSMTCVTQITQNQVQGIWSGTITNWNAIDATCASATIVPRSRTTVSGSYPDMLRLFGISSGAEATTITNTGLSRLTTSQDEADAACNNVNQVVYTSLANLLTFGPAGSGCLKALSLSAGSSSTYVAPSVTSVQNGTYPASRQLFLAINKFSVVGTTAATDTSSHVKAYDLVNYMLSSAGQTAVAQVGFVNQPLPASQPIPDADVNLDGAIGLGDIGNILGRWGQSQPSCPHWIRADASSVGAVGLGAVGKVLGKWGGTGFVAP